MRSRTTAFTLVAVVLLVVGTVSTRAAPVFEAVTLDDYSGEELFERFCASCHGAGARGDGPVSRSLNVAVPDLTSIELRYGEFPTVRIRDVIDGRGIDMSAHGTRTMPVWGYEFWVEEGADITAQNAVRNAINRLVEHVRSLQRSDAAPRDGRAATAE
jgi:mono/diheme cytochrome c family protein